VRKLVPVLFLAFLTLLLGIIALRLTADEDSWICQEGKWVKHGNPMALKPQTPCGNIFVVSPVEGETIGNPVVIKGEARVFENQFNWRILDEDSSLLGDGTGASDAKEVGEYGDFEIVATYAKPQGDRGTLEVFDYAAKDGKVVDKVEIGIAFGEYKTTTVKVYFANKKAEAGKECQADFPIDRLVPKTQAVGRASLDELLKGPSVEEREKGYLTGINEGVKVEKLTIENGVARADFNSRLEEAVGGSCRVSLIRSQIVNTLLQFPTVKKVVISIEGRTEDILQP
jgi:hypothetical protein